MSFRRVAEGRTDETQLWHCNCTAHCELRRKTTSAGSVLIGLQCLRCGCWDPKRRADFRGDVLDLPEFDPAINRHFSDQQAAIGRARLDAEQVALEQKRKAENAEWWKKYNAYLASPQWKAKRAKVLGRSMGACESCAEAPATEVHHTTYAHVFEEPLFDLRAVCKPCHERLTARDRANRERRRW